MRTQQVLAGAGEEKGDGRFIILRISIPPLLSLSVAHVCFIPGSGPHQTLRLQRGKETDRMTPTSEDAPNVIKEVQLLKRLPSIRLLCC